MSAQRQASARTPIIAAPGPLRPEVATKVVVAAWPERRPPVVARIASWVPARLL